jgi:hypothetical protein
METSRDNHVQRMIRTRRGASTASPFRGPPATGSGYSLTPLKTQPNARRAVATLELRLRDGLIIAGVGFVSSIYKATFERNDPRFAVDAFTTSFSTHFADSDFERENGVQSQWTL